MFLDLFRLYKKNGYSERSPLEDFNTEVFAGILRLDSKVFHEFLALLNLPDDQYEIKTQRRYSLIKRPDCIIDMVLIGEENICFIENKVHSGEGWEQLDRYCEALDVHFEERKKFLIYCTKFTDHKIEIRHDFKQIRWYQIASILSNYMDKNPYILNYFEFLKHHNMAQKNTFTPEMIMSMENIHDAVETIKIHVENTKPYFEKIFGVKYSKFQEAPTGHQDRVAGYIENILPQGAKYSELLYCIKVSLVKLQTQIFINKSHTQINLVKEKIKEYNQEGRLLELKFNDHPDGFVIWQDRKIYDLLNDPEADEKIKNWFIDSFNSVAEFIKATPELEWNQAINCKQENEIIEQSNPILNE